MPVISRVLDEPVDLYKMVSLPDGAGHAIMKMVVPRGATMAWTGYLADWRGRDPRTELSPLVRVSMATPVHIAPVNRPKNVVMAGCSIRQPSFKYALGKKISSPIDTELAHGNGIHGFFDEGTARLWPMLFGRSPA